MWAGVVRLQGPGGRARRRGAQQWGLHSGSSPSPVFMCLLSLRRLQCGRCPWTWGSAHVHILFHVRWDGAGGRGLVRMCVQGQPCQLCPPDTLRECQVSPGDVRAFLGQLVLYILQKCYGDTPGPERRPEAFPGGCCEACDRGVCFLQRGPVPHSSSARAEGQRLLPSGSRHAAPGPGGHGRRPLTVPLLVVGFSEDPSSEESAVLNEDTCTVIVPFTLVGAGRGPGCAIPGEGAVPAAGGNRPPVIGRGSIYLSGSSAAGPGGRGVLVNVRAPIFHDQSFLGNMVKTFELRGFLFGGRDSVPSSVGVAKGQGPISVSNGPAVPETALSPGFYTIGLTASGEGALALPSTLADTLRGKAPVLSIAKDAVQEDGGRSPAAGGHRPPPESSPSGPGARSEEGLVTFPFSFSADKDSSTEKGDRRGPAAAGRDAALENSARSLLSIREGAISVPFSVFSLWPGRGSGPSASAPQCVGAVSSDHYKRRRLRSRSGKSSCGPRREEDFHSRRSSRRSGAQASEDFWICVSLIICIFWLMCVYRLNLGTYQQ
ncbi:PREDICTED: receptor-transporting protein 5 [Dipodomys ordii]|uniref:Receptor-transporting protein 5 n=1 Tax=Dipodomys ordii TaxID=10020 RepID=A0A1S3GJX3_DIPOR|nr:PREDICTED: receptor-transporting protein 5 [Dipodomys ordii]